MTTTARRTRGRIAGRAGAALAGLALAVAGLPALPAAAEIGPGGTPTGGVYGQQRGTQTDAVSNLVHDIEQIGNTIYVSGKFTESRASSGAAPLARPFVAAFNATTGAPITGFNAPVNGPVYALQASPDGSRLLIGGEFTAVGADTGARGLAALDPTTGALDPSWRATLTTDSGAQPIVFDLAVDGGSLYLGGRFDTVSGHAGAHRSQRVAKVSVGDGRPDTSFAVTATGGAVRALAVAPDGGRVYAGGAHYSVDGRSDQGQFTVLDAATGSSLPAAISWSNGQLASWFPNVYAVAAVNNLLFFAGSNNAILVYDVNTGREVARHYSDGDFQRLAVVGDRVYAGGHYYLYHRDQDGRITDHRRVTAYSATTGDFIPSFKPTISADRSGVWAIHGATDGCLWVGGDLTSMAVQGGGTRALGGVAKLCDDGLTNGIDTAPPSAPAELVQTRAENRKIVIRYSAATDNVGVAAYEVRRDGQVVDVEPHTSSREWFVDSGLEPGTTYRYEVVAVDAAGNRGPAAVLDAATSGAAATPDPDPDPTPDPDPDPTPDPDPAALAAPEGLRSTRQTRERIVLNWQRVSGAASYVIEVDTDAGWVEAGAKTSRWFTHLQLTSGTEYRYRVRAVDAQGTRGEASAVLAVSTNP